MILEGKIAVMSGGEPVYGPANAQQPRPALKLADRPAGAIRFFEYDPPGAQTCWHYHDDYELHYIAATAGKAFVGDFIGVFEPGQLYLTGPMLPHNWVAKSPAKNGHCARDKLIQFDHQTVAGLAQMVPELAELMPLLVRSRFGILFHGDNEPAASMLDRIRDSKGAARFGHFCHLMHEISRRNDYSLLSKAPIETRLTGRQLEKINLVVEYLMLNYHEEFPMARVSTMLGMSESGFSRFFHRATGRRYRDFLIGLRISKACELLLETDRQIITICFDVGFRNVANFYRRFRERKGFSPSEFRRQAGDKTLMP